MIHTISSTSSSSSSSSSPKEKIEQVFKKLDENRLPNLSDISNLIKSGSVKNIIIMAGAGISTEAGIPDFRSPNTGLYANLEKFNLPYPEAIFDISYFRKNPTPFYTFADEINPKKFKPTKTHEFFKLLENKKLLKKCFTQNIDTLERLTGLSDNLIVEAHGSFATCHCIECNSEVSQEEFMQRLTQNPSRLVKCLQKSCLDNSTAFIKPDIVFFGEQLPKIFHESTSDFSEADLLIVLGTSLQVEPFASLIKKVSINCPRLLINLEAVGEINNINNPDGFDFKGIKRLGNNKFIRDVLFLGTTDDAIEELCDLLGWKDELLNLYDKDQDVKTNEANQDSEDGDKKEQEEIQSDLNNSPDDKKLIKSKSHSNEQNIAQVNKTRREEEVQDFPEENTTKDAAQDAQPVNTTQDQKENVHQSTSIIEDLYLSLSRGNFELSLKDDEISKINNNIR